QPLHFQALTFSLFNPPRYLNVIIILTKFASIVNEILEKSNKIYYTFILKYPFALSKWVSVRIFHVPNNHSNSNAPV
ncbi:MAG: hypothetical protein Q3Y24_02280, partial [Clostridia bacterium]|nr:hypothetical protein [Clostridia bacterium]